MSSEQGLLAQGRGGQRGGRGRHGGGQLVCMQYSEWNSSSNCGKLAAVLRITKSKVQAHQRSMGTRVELALPAHPPWLRRHGAMGQLQRGAHGASNRPGSRRRAKEDQGARQAAQSGFQLKPPHCPPPRCRSASYQNWRLSGFCVSPPSRASWPNGGLPHGPISTSQAAVAGSSPLSNSQFISIFIIKSSNIQGPRLGIWAFFCACVGSSISTIGLTQPANHHQNLHSMARQMPLQSML